MIILNTSCDRLLSDFAEIVPFDHVLTKIFTYQKKSAVIALNRDVAYLIRDSVELFGFKVEGIIPTYILLGESAQPFSLQLAQLITQMPGTPVAQVAEQLFKGGASLLQDLLEQFDVRNTDGVPASERTNDLLFHI